MTRGCAAALAAAFLLAACSDQEAPPADSAAPRDTGGPDRAADLPPADLVLPDRAVDLLSCPDGAADAGTKTVSISGHAHNFTGKPSRLEGAKIWLMEQPCKRTVSVKNGAFEITGLKPNSEASLRMELAGWPPIQTGTFSLGSDGVNTATFQAPSHIYYKALAAIVKLTPDPKTCQMVTTVTSVGKDMTTPGAHGEAGVTVTLSPALPKKHGPIYFNKLVLPDHKRTETSEDGGVLYVNVPPGEYTWTAHKAGIKFHQVKMKCRAGWLVNASPPWGLQAYK